MDHVSKAGQNRAEIDESILPQIRKRDLSWAYVFIPGTYLLIFLSVLVTIALPILAILGFCFMFDYNIWSLPPFVLFVFGLFTVILIYESVKAVILSFFTGTWSEEAILVQDNGEEMEGALKEVCTKLNIPVPDNLFVCFAPEFYVTQVPVSDYQNTVYKGRSLVVGLPFLPYMTCDEFKSILSHEMAHFTGRDTIFSIRVAPIYKSIGIFLERIGQRANQDLFFYLFIGPTRFILTRYIRLVSRHLAAISREREKRADFVATLLYGKENFVQGLTKISNIAQSFSERVNKDFLAEETIDHPIENYIQFFVDHFDSALLLDDKVNQEETGLFDAHCSNKDRFDYIPDHEIPKVEKCFAREKLEQYEKELTAFTMAAFNVIRPYVYASNKIKIDLDENSGTKADLQSAEESNAESKSESGEEINLSSGSSESTLPPSEKILFEAKYGLFWSEKLRLTETDIIYQKKVIPFSAIDAYLAYGTGYGDQCFIVLKTELNKKPVRISMKNEAMFNELLPILWQKVGNPILISWLKKIQKGETILFESLVIADDFVEIPRKSFWRKSHEKDRVPWKDVGFGMQNGLFTIQSRDKKNQVTFSANKVGNLLVLFELLNIFSCNGDHERLSSIIKTEQTM